MNNLKVCFTGVGSIAKRHIRNLRDIAEARGINIQIDAFRRSGIAIEGVDAVYTELSETPNDYDAVFRYIKIVPR